MRLIITNHSAEPRDASCRILIPTPWRGDVAEPPSAVAGPDWASTAIKPKADGEVKLALRIPPDVKPGRYIVPVDVRYGTWDLPQFTEALVAFGE